MKPQGSSPAPSCRAPDDVVGAHNIVRRQIEPAPGSGTKNASMVLRGDVAISGPFVDPVHAYGILGLINVGSKLGPAGPEGHDVDYRAKPGHAMTNNGQKVHSSSMGKTPMDLFSTGDHASAMKNHFQSALLPPEMHPDRVGIRVTAAREALRLSKAEFADSIELDRSTLTKIEAGTRGLDIAVGAKIAHLYGIGLDYIYRGVLTDVPENLRSTVVAQIHAAQSAKLFGTDATDVVGNRD